MDETTRQLSQLYRRTTRPQGNCPSSKHLATLAQGSSWPWQRRRLASHLAECPHCASEFRSVLAIREGLNEALHAPRDRDPRSGWMTAFGTAGACAALIAAVLLLPRGDESSAPAGGKSDLLFASDFAPASDSNSDETLFRGDFDGQRPDTVFSSDFGTQS